MSFGLSTIACCVWTFDITLNLTLYCIQIESSDFNIFLENQQHVIIPDE